MAEVKGKFISLACSLIQTKPAALQAARDAVKEMTGMDYMDLDPEGWYNTNVFDAVFSALEEHSSPILAWASIKVVGLRVYPTIEATAGLPKHFISPLDFVRFEADGFLANHRGRDVIPRKFLKAEEGHVIVEAPSPGYNCALIEGVFEGILQMCGVAQSKVVQTKCKRKGDSTCVYNITWQHA
jgi:predicted hydrocarbon binding protein